MYLEHLIRKVMRPEADQTMLDLIAFQHDPELSLETLKPPMHFSLDGELQEVFSPPEYIVKRLLLRSLVRDASAFQLSLKITGIPPSILSFFEAGLIKEERSRVRARLASYQGVQVMDDGILHIGVLGKETAAPPEIIALNGREQRMLYQHSFLLPPLISELNFQHVGGGDWFCESNLFHQGGRINTLPVIPYAGLMPPDYDPERVTSLFAVPHLVNGRALHFTLKTLNELSHEGFLMEGGLKIGAFFYVFPKRFETMNAAKPLKHVVELGGIITELKWPAYETPFIYQSCAYRSNPNTPHLIDVCFKRT